MMRLPALVVNDDTTRRYFALAVAVKKVPVAVATANEFGPVREVVAVIAEKITNS
jgi:hypothetical protein